MNATPGASIPLVGFGASDCHCASHLYFFKSRPHLRANLLRIAGKLHEVLAFSSGVPLWSLDSVWTPWANFDEAGPNSQRGKCVNY
jgi:hypothetical protein